MRNLKSCDLLGGKVRFKIDSRNTFKTPLGGLITILTVIGVIIFTWFIGNDIIYRENPISFQQQSLSIKTPNITINRNSFPMGISVYSINSEILFDPTFFSIELIYQKWKIKNDVYVNEDIYVNLEPCTMNHFPTLSKNTFKELALDKILCPDYNSVNIFGSWSEPEMNRFKLQLKMCDWEKHKDFCKSESEIKAYFKKNGPNLNILYLDLQINVKNYSSPIEYFPLYFYKFSVPEFLKLSYVYIQKQKIYTDDDLFLSDIKEDSFLKLVEETTDIKDVDHDDKITNLFFIMSSNKFDSYYRKYIKGPEIIAVVGGLMKSITFFMAILVRYFSGFDFYRKLINRIYKIEKTNHDIIQMTNVAKISDHVDFINNDVIKNLAKNEKKEYNNFFKINRRINEEIFHSIEDINKPKSNNIIYKGIDKESFNNVNVIQECSRDNINIPIDPQKKLSKFTQENNKRKSFIKLEFSIKDKLRYILSRCSKKISESNKNYLLIDHGEKKINNNLEISTILLHLEEYKIFKQIFISEDKIIAFNEFMNNNPSLDENKQRININNMKNKFLEILNKNDKKKNGYISQKEN